MNGLLSAASWPFKSCVLAFQNVLNLAIHGPAALGEQNIERKFEAPCESVQAEISSVHFRKQRIFADHEVAFRRVLAFQNAFKNPSRW